MAKVPTKVGTGEVNFMEGTFVKMSDGVELYTNIKEQGGKPWLVFTHGVGEHSGRHDYLSEIFGEKFNIFRYDLRGHARGQGATIHDFWQYVGDLEEILGYLREKYRMKHYLLFGHSMGALIVSGYLKKCAGEYYPEKVFLSAPPVGFPGILGKVVNLTSVEIFKKLGRFSLALPLGGLIDLTKLSHDVEVGQRYREDDLCQKRPPLKLFVEIARASKEIFSSPLNPRCPSFVAYGTGDRIIDPDSTRHYFEQVETSFKVRKFEGAYHELHNEVKKYREPYIQFLKDSLF